MRIYIAFALLFVGFGIFAQDNYHNELIMSFQTENGLEAPDFLFENTEVANNSSMYIYGATQIDINDIEGFDFTKQISFDIPTAGSNAWDSGAGNSNKTSVTQGDVLVYTFWARRTGSSSEVLFFVEDSQTYDKYFYQAISFTPDWNQYFIAVKAAANYSIGGLSAGFHLAGLVQKFELGGFTAFNFGPIDIESVPSSFSTGAYEGSESDAPWRAAAADRIESLRKADLNIIVKDANGNPIKDAEVKVEMQEHEFKFGSAFVTCRFPGNNCYDATYVEKVFDLDGLGHGFNAGVTENAMKWDGWESEWLGTPEQTVSAVKYMSDNGISMRGHTLIWPGYGTMPDDIEQNKNDLNYLRSRIATRIDEMINNPTLKEIVREWDVLNEITQNRDLETAFMADPNFTTGREIYQEIMADVRALDPDLKLYINDYIVLSGGGSSTSVVDRYKTYLDEIHNSSQPFDGIGFQGHIGPNPTSIPKVEAVFDDFFERYGKRMSVTEYDISELVDPEVQANYLEDFMTMTFSHPSMDAFIMWGFWDGNHWKGNAPIFDIDWNIKPSGQAFIDKVFGEWWTDESLISNENGMATLRAFKGTHKITVTSGEETVESFVTLGGDEEIEITLSMSSSLDELAFPELIIVPNLVSDGYLSLQSTSDLGKMDVSIFDIAGVRHVEFKNVQTGSRLNINLASGSYFVKVSTSQGLITRKIVVE